MDKIAVSIRVDCVNPVQGSPDIFLSSAAYCNVYKVIQPRKPRKKESSVYYRLNDFCFVHRLPYANGFKHPIRAAVIFVYCTGLLNPVCCIGQNPNLFSACGCNPSNPDDFGRKITFNVSDRSFSRSGNPRLCISDFVQK